MSRPLARKAAVLLSGSVMAQALPLLAAPVLTRLYTPAEFGVFGLFTAAVAILGALGNLKFDHAILLARRAPVAWHVFALGLLASTVLAAMLMLWLVLAPASWFGTRWLALDRHIALLVPLNFAMAAANQAVVSMIFRGEQVAWVAQSRVLQALVTTVASIGLGWWSPTGAMLIASAIGGQLLGMLHLAWRLPRRRVALWQFSARVMWRCARRYRRFPMFTVPSELLGVLTTSLPILLIGSTWGLEAAGAYALAQRVLGTPLSMLGSAFSDAYRQSAAGVLRAGQDYWDMSRRTAAVLGAVAVPGALATMALAPSMFPWIFGQRWGLAGELVQILAPLYFVRLLVSPLSYNYYIAGRNAEDLVLQVLSFASTLAILALAGRAATALHPTLVAYTVFLFAIYVVYGVRSLWFAHLSRRAALASA